MNPFYLKSGAMIMIGAILTTPIEAVILHNAHHLDHGPERPPTHIYVGEKARFHVTFTSFAPGSGSMWDP